MAVTYVAIVLTEYPIIDREGKLSIGGVVDTVQFARMAGLPPGTVSGDILLNTPISLVAILSASIAWWM